MTRGTLMDDLNKLTGIDNLAVEAAMHTLEEGVVAAASYVSGTASGAMEPSTVRLKASLWLLEFYLGRGKAAESSGAKGETDWGKALDKMAQAASEHANRGFVGFEEGDSQGEVLDS